MTGLGILVAMAPALAAIAESVEPEMLVAGLTEKQPLRSRWASMRTPEVLRFDPQNLAVSMWSSEGVSVISTLIRAELPDGSGVGLQWHLSVSRHGKRPSARELARALADFGMTGTEEDNHHPGGARHFFLVVDPSKRVACQCKSDEQQIVERDGYRWSNPKPTTGEACRGCDFQRVSGKPCPIHGVGEICAAR